MHQEPALKMIRCTNVQARADGALLGLAEDIDVYFRTTPTLDEVGDAVEAELKELGWDCNGASFSYEGEVA